MRLLGVEVSRFTHRRAVAVVLAGVALLGVVLLLSAVYSTRQPDPTERAVAQQSLTRALADHEQELRSCRADPEAELGPEATVDDCRSPKPTLDWFLPRPELSLADEVTDRGLVLLVLLAAGGMLLGATFAGADWSSGSMGTQLLFRPGRTGVWLAKAVAVVLGATVSAAVLLVVYWGVLAAVARQRGITTSSATWDAVLGSSGRGLALVAAATLGTYALTMLLRSTVGTLGLLFGYAVVGEGLAASLPFARATQWSLANNVFAWVENGRRVHDQSVCDGAGAPCTPSYVLGLDHAALYLGIALLVAVLVSVLAFRTRDVR